MRYKAYFFCLKGAFGTEQLPIIIRCEGLA